MGSRPGAEVITLFFSYSTQLHTDFIMLINIKRPTIVGILTIFNIINIISESWKEKNPLFSAFLLLRAVEMLCSVELSMKKVFNLDILCLVLNTNMCCTVLQS